MADADDIPQAPSGRTGAILLGLVLALQLGRLVTDMLTTGAAADEPRHLATGAFYLSSGACCLGAHDTPAAVPYTLAFHGGLDAGFPMPRERPAPEGLGRRLFLEGAGLPGLVRARLLNLPFAVALVLSVYFLARRFAGEHAAVAVAALTALDPNALAHGHLVSPDFLELAMLPIASLAGVRLVERPSLGRGLVLGLALAALFLTKYSAFAPAAVILALTALWPAGDWKAALRLRALPIAAGLALAVVCVLAAYRVPPLRFYYPVGLEVTRRLLARGYPTFFLGEYGKHFLSYYAVGLAVKIGTPLLLLLPLGAVELARRRLRSRWGNPFGVSPSPFRLGPAFAFLILPAATLLLAATLSRYAIAVRHVLPVLPALAAIAVLPLERLAPRLRTAAVGALLVIMALPRPGLAYGNVLAKAMGGLDRILSGANVDWGEDVPALVEYRRRNPEGILVASIFSVLPLSFYGLDEVIELPGTTPHKPTPPWPLPPGVRYFAISVLDLQGTHFPDHDRYALFRTRRPDAILNGTILVFDVSADAEALARLEEIRATVQAIPAG